MPLDINSTQQSIQSKIDAYKTYREVSTSEKGEPAKELSIA